MSGTADKSLIDAMTALHEALESTGAPFMIIGGIAVIVRGVPRLTQDIDATIAPLKKNSLAFTSG